MFHIVRFEIDKKALIDKAESRQEQVRRIQDLGDIQSYKGVFCTKALATTSPEFFEIENSLRYMFGDRVNYKVIDCTADYRLLRTRAPQNYDYDYVVEVGTVPGESGPERLVAMPVERVAYQSGRYSSGMYTPIDCGWIPGGDKPLSV